MFLQVSGGIINTLLWDINERDCQGTHHTSIAEGP